MKTKPKRRLLSVLLCCVMLLSLMPTHAHAWDTVIECEYCGSICGDDYICSGGDHCSEASGRDCYEEHHCSDCGECQDNTEFCENCGMCVECAQSNGQHCTSCGKCQDEGALCEVCSQCGECGGECSEGIETCNACLECHRDMGMACQECETCYSQESLYCPDCGLCGINCVAVCEECAKCEECAAEDGTHCPNCYECYTRADPCPDCGFCSLCTDFCENCGMCVECAVDAGLHCPDCQECVGEDERCIICGLCAICEYICEDCHMCLECAVDEQCHCPNCCECYVDYLPCPGECGTCENCADWCETCEMCVDCAMDEGKHCPDCGECAAEDGCGICGRCLGCGDECSEGLDNCGICLICHLENEGACEQCEYCFLSPDREGAQCLGSCGLCKECSTEWCDDCHMCEDCAVEELCHCQECYNCLVGDDQVCEECKRCSGCCIFCEACNMCEDCGVENDTHCPDCGTCTKEDGCGYCFRCKDCGGECSVGLDSCGICLICHLENEGACEQCEYCFYGRDEDRCLGSCGLCKECATEWCDDCHMCEECAIEEECHCQICGGCLVDAGGVCEGCNRCHNCFDDWCSTCLLCVECAIEDGKHCPDCGICTQENDGCLLCHRCAECGGECSEGIICGACLECHLDEGVACEGCNQCFLGPGLEELQCQVCGYCSECVMSWCDACQMCGACAMGEGLHCPECNTCYEEAEHTCIGCGRCSACFEDWCDTCELCIECAAADGLHCPDCMICHTDADSYCENCGKCSDCTDAQCPDCEWCGDCVTLCGNCGYCENDAAICPDCGEACSECSAVCGYCGSCENCEDLCVNCGGYCTGCAALCGGCGYCGEECADRCTQCGERCSNCSTVCPICWMCEECCKSNSQAAGCDHNVCIRGDEWDTHWSAEHASGEHAHVYTNYSSDASGHWQVCKVSDCRERTATEAHVFGPWWISIPATETSMGEKSRLCTVCEYWETEDIPLLDHVHQLTLVPAKAATCTQNGNRAYYTCTCGKWFVDEAGKQEITDKSTVVLYGGHTASGWKSDASNHWKVCVTAGCGTVLADTKAAHTYGGDSVCDICGYDKGTTYKVTEGAGGTWIKGDSATLLFKANGSITRFTGIQVDDAAVDPAMYTAVNGSTVVTLKREYLDSLSLGSHTLTFVYTDGEAGTYFTILTAASGDPGHTHTFTLVPETAASCTASGRKTHYICSCGRLFSAQNAAAEITDFSSLLIPATGHDYRWIIDLEATAEQDGSKHQECRYCHDAKAPVVIPALGSEHPHEHSYTKEVVPPTCTEKGYTEYICACGSNYRDNYVDPTGHVDADNSGKCDICASEMGKGPTDSGGSSVTTYTITASAGEGGSISPSGRVFAAHNSDKTFTITADKGYEISDVVVDGKSVGAVERYAFEQIRANHTIHVTFVQTIDEGDTPLGSLPFPDIPEGSWYEDAVIWAVDKGITAGTSATAFSPDGICTRAQVVTFLWRAAGSPAPKSDAMPFSDVPVGSWYYDAVLWAVEQGITAGTSAAIFSPDLNCTRAQIVTLLYRAAGSPAVSGSAAFSDVATDAYYASAVKWAEMSGITSGIGGGLFGSDNDCTRAQIVTFIYRYMEK